jgi:acyl-coenzyme A thioesterase PaaI-like protein
LTPRVLNHLGTMHAAAQFALAEAASAERLRRDYGDLAGGVFAVVRGVTVKYRHPAAGDLLAFAEPDDFTRTHLRDDLAKRTRTTATVLVELKDRAGALTFAGSFVWFLARESGETSTP